MHINKQALISKSLFILERDSRKKKEKYNSEFKPKILGDYTLK